MYAFSIMQIIVPCVARFVMQPTALHWTSTFGLPIWRMSCSRPPSLTIKSLFSAVASHQFVCWQSPLSTRNLLLTAKLPNAALAARCTSTSCDCSRNRMGFNVSRPTCRTSEEYASIRTAVSFSPPPIFLITFLCNFCKSQRCWSLQINVIREG